MFCMRISKGSKCNFFKNVVLPQKGWLHAGPISVSMQGSVIWNLCYYKQYNFAEE